MVPAKPKRSGQANEDALYAALVASGFQDAGDMGPRKDGGRTVSIQVLDGQPGSFCSRSDKGLPPLEHCFIRQYPWGAYLSPSRRFSADAAFPFGASRLLVEVEGQVHSIKGKRKGDVVRRQLAENEGWRVLSVLPEQIANGEAVALVKRAVAVTYAGVWTSAAKEG